MAPLLRLLALSAAAVLATGCATPVYENYLPWSEGWRLGKVSRAEATADDFAFYKRRCRANQLEGTPARFAIVQWRDVSRSRWTIALLPEDVAVAAGDLVYVKVWDCSTALVKREKS
ncbi:hypothetical protein LJR066_000628 [Acidovorax sp. LjRoot66]|jgi:hypothetical protein|uniref:hypothetical protein n=1 Tax=Acidovorax sp. LjRoot66 TaxID=3342334 RepID=UPI003ECD2822